MGLSQKSPFNDSFDWDEIDKMSIEDIDSLMPQLAAALEEAKLKEKQAKEQRHISEVVEEKFAEVWTDVENELTEEFKRDTLKEKEDFILKEGFKIVLESRIGKDNTDLFFKTLGDCVRKRDFKFTQRFYKTVEDSEVVETAKVGFAVYRLHLSNRVRGDYVKPKRAMEYIREFKKSGNPVALSTLNAFSEVGLLPD
jgi:hypothetical protein